jgi:hypothetical protein
MGPERVSIADLRGLWGATRDQGGDNDYALVAEVEGAFAARSRAGLPALIVPIRELGPAPIGRRAAGCELVGHSSIRFVYGDRNAVGPAAALLCLDPELFDAFAVLAVDVAKRVRDGGGTWSSMVEAVEEWQTLLARSGQLGAEVEQGLWGELWFLAQAADVDLLFSAWRGPEADATDFFLAGKSVEVKTSRRRRDHHVSCSQVDAPVGAHDGWMLSIWVKPDPASACTIAQLAEGLLDRARDRAEVLRRLTRAGYSPADRATYRASFVVLAEPEWYAITDVPRVRVVDPGVSQLRYRVALDETRRADVHVSDSLWRHFHTYQYGGQSR